MQNQDFESPERIEEVKKSIRDELGIKEEMLPEIRKLDKNNSQDAVMKALYMKSIFGIQAVEVFGPPHAALLKPVDVKGLVRLNPEVFNMQNTSQYHAWTDVLNSLRPEDLKMRKGPNREKANRPKKRKDVERDKFILKKRELEDEEKPILPSEGETGGSPDKDDDGDVR